MVVGLLGNESPDSNRFIPVTPKSENDVRLQATLGNQNPTGLPVGAVRDPELTIERALETYVKKGYSREWINQRLQAIQLQNIVTNLLEADIGSDEN